MSNGNIDLGQSRPKKEVPIYTKDDVRCIVEIEGHAREIEINHLRSTCDELKAKNDALAEAICTLVHVVRGV